MFLITFLYNSIFMKFQFKIIHLTPLFVAVESKSLEIVKLLLSRPEININEKSISL